MITFYTVGTAGTVCCTGEMEFGIAAGSTRLTFSTLATTNTSETIAVDTTVPMLLDVTETWTNTNANQGTRISYAQLRATGF